MSKIKNFFKNSYDRMSIFYLLTFILWIKSYLIQRFMYELPITTFKQEFILLISPLSSALLFLAIAALFSFKKTRSMLAMNFLFTTVLYGNVLYYRFYDDFVTIPVLFQTSNMGDLGGSVMGLMEWQDILLYIDIVILFIIYFAGKLPNKKPYKTELGIIMGLVAGVFTFNLLLAETERTELLTRTFDREILVKNLGTHNYLIYDIVLQTKSKTQKIFSNPEDFKEVEKYTDEKKINPLPEMEGIAKGKNVVYISMESLQSFVINNKLHGEEVTPFLNKLIKESYYFDNFYHQTSQGKTSDAEFIMENGMYGVPRGAVYFTNATNNFEAMPEILGNNGYYTSVFHANNKSFWNRDVIYPNFKYDKFYDVDSYEVNEENSVGWGLKDKPFFEQSVNIMKDIDKPFYAKMLTLTNHYPFVLDEKDATLEKFDSNSKTLNAYFQTVRYLDESLEEFFEEMKESGLYDKTIFVLYGDHYGISELHNRSMAKYLEKDKITKFDTAQLQRVPLIIHIPGQKGKTISTVTGQIDVRPTVLNLLGIKSDYTVEFGQDMFAKNPETGWTAFRDGSFITKDNVYFDEDCYDKATGEKTDDEFCSKDVKEQVQTELDLNDKLINGDLMKMLKKDRKVEIKDAEKTDVVKENEIEKEEAEKAETDEISNNASEESVGNSMIEKE